MNQAEFWYEFASTYSYPAAMRVEALAAARGVALVWRPFLLGPIFAEAGWRDSPFNLYPIKGRYMWRDMERVCASLGLPLVRPQPFPQNGLLAARVAISLPDQVRAAFSKRVYHAEFGQGRSISDVATLSDLIADCGLDPAQTLAAAQSDANKAELRAQGERAKQLGLPGAPCLTTGDGEVFWGNDRLEPGLAWASGDGRALPVAVEPQNR